MSKLQDYEFLLRVRTELEMCWSLETTYTPENFEGKDTATGQCAVTCYVVRKLFPEVKIMQGYAVKGAYSTRHYWLRVNKVDIDFTWRQFEPGFSLHNIEKAKLKDLATDKWMKKRCELLLRRFCHLHAHHVMPS